MLDPDSSQPALGDPDQLIQAAWTPLSKDAMSRLQAFMTLAEGYATFVMDAVGARLLSDHARLKEAMERRSQSLSPGDALLERLLGLELKRRQYEEGVKFCRYVAGVRDIESLNRAWDNPDSLPTVRGARETRRLARSDRWIAGTSIRAEMLARTLDSWNVDPGELLRADRYFLARNSSSFASGQVLITMSALTQPRCAVPMPKCMLSNSSTECASVEMTNFTPCSRAQRTCSSRRSSRYGCVALISSATPCSTHAFATQH